MCHECIINENNEIAGASQDDIELVNTANSQGYKLLQSEDSKIIKLNIDGEEKSFPVIKMIEFSSSRKRASILIKDGDLYKMYTKGADSEIVKRLGIYSRGDFLDSCYKYVNYFSTLGYRTLFIAMKIITEEEVIKFQNKMKQIEKFPPKKEKLFMMSFSINLKKILIY